MVEKKKKTQKKEKQPQSEAIQDFKVFLNMKNMPK